MRVNFLHIFRLFGKDSKKGGKNMPVSIRNSQDEVTAIIEGEIDHHTATEIRKCIDESVERIRPKLLKIDFSQVSFMDSSGIGLIMGRYNTMKIIGGKVEVQNPTPAIEKILKISGIQKLAKITKTQEVSK
jgi:stage II sporulation protein AA (anti-sigma F factor antagonist)